MRDSDKEALLLLLLVWAYTSSSESAAAAPAAPAAPPRRRRRDPSMVDVGWWWYWYPAELDAQVSTWRQEQRNTLSVKKTIGSSAKGATVIVFEVAKRFRWTLPGLPQRAPQQLNTDWSDVAWAIPDPPSILRRVGEEAARQTWEFLRKLGYERTSKKYPW